MATSLFTLGHLQANGMRYVVETHTDDFAVTERVEYGPVGALDYSQIMLNRAAAIAAEKIASEVSQNISAIVHQGSLASIKLVRSTAAQNLGPLREAYRNADREAAIMVADYLATLTDAQLRNIFSKIQAEVTALRATKLTPAIDMANTIRAARGE